MRVVTGDRISPNEYPLVRGAFTQLKAHLCSRPSGRIMVLVGVEDSGKSVLIQQGITALPEPQRARCAVFSSSNFAINQELKSTLQNQGITHLFIKNVIPCADKKYDDDNDMLDIYELLPLAEKYVITITSRNTLYFRLVNIPEVDVVRLSYIAARERIHIVCSKFPYSIQGMLYSSDEDNDVDIPNIQKIHRRRYRYNFYSTIESLRHDMRLLQFVKGKQGKAISIDLLKNEGSLEDVFKNIMLQTIIEVRQRTLPHENIALPKMQRPERSVLQLLEMADILAPCPEETPEQRMAARWLAVNAAMKTYGCDAYLADIDDIKIRKALAWAVKEDIALDAILLDLLTVVPDTIHVSSLIAPRHRLILISDMRRRRCALVTVSMKGLDQLATRPLRDPATIAGVSRRHGAVVRQVVLYEGETHEDNGILWQNANEFLCLIENPAAIDWICRFDKAFVPGAPVNRSARRFPMPTALAV